MAYTYGMKGAPAVGQGAPGLPRRWQPEASQYTSIKTAGAGVLIPPQGAKMMRVAVIGASGGVASGLQRGAGGGGCAASKIVPACPISYYIGSGGIAANTPNDGESSTASFYGYLLVGGGGIGNRNTTPSGGIASGGDYNYTGGSGGTGASYAGGGGAAGPNGNGGNAATGGLSAVAGFFDGRGWGVGGGSAGLNSSQGGIGSGPGGVNGDSVTLSTPTGWPWGKHNGGGGQGGADMGGAPRGDTSSSINGSPGGMVVEWFY